MVNPARTAVARHNVKESVLQVSLLDRRAVTGKGQQRCACYFRCLAVECKGFYASVALCQRKIGRERAVSRYKRKRRSVTIRCRSRDLLNRPGPGVERDATGADVGCRHRPAQQVALDLVDVAPRR